MDRASKDLGKKTRAEQTNFDAVYERIDIEKDVAQIVPDPSTHRKLDKNKRDIKKDNERNKELGISVVRAKSYEYPEHDR